MLRILFFLCLLASVPAEAGFRRGNGAFVIGCGQEPTITYQLLDLFEAKSRYNLKSEFEQTGDEFVRARAVIARLARLNPTRQKMYDAWLTEFSSESRFIDNLNIVTNADVGVSFIPDNCFLKQLIVQVEPQNHFESRYTIDQRIWNSLDTDNRAAALVHELIYREAISFENQHGSSEPTRLLNAYIHTNAWQTDSLQTWLLLLQDLGFHRGDANSFEVRLNSFADSSYGSRKKTDLQFFDENTVSRATIPATLDFELFGNSYSYSCNKNLEISSDGAIVEFFPNGKLMTLNFSRRFETNRCPDLFFSVGTAEKEFYLFSAPVYGISFNVDGEVTQAFGAKNDTIVDINLSRELNKLMVRGEVIKVERSFDFVIEPWAFTVNFVDNKPTFLINTYYNKVLSKTSQKSGKDFLQIQSLESQAIY